MSTRLAWGRRHAALISDWGVAVVPCVDSRTAGKQRHRFGRPAIVRQGGRVGVNWIGRSADLIAVDAVDEAGGRAHLRSDYSRQRRRCRWRRGSRRRSRCWWR